MSYLYEKFVALMKWVYDKVVAFLSPVATSIRGKINIDEFLRILTLALTTGGSVYGALAIIFQDLTLFVTDAALAREVSLAVGILTFLFDYLRRRNHGPNTK